MKYVSICVCVFKRVDIASDVWEEVKKKTKTFLNSLIGMLLCSWYFSETMLQEMRISKK